MVTSALHSAGHSNPSAWQARLPAEYQKAHEVGLQIFLINRTWRLIVGELRDMDTTNIRYGLIDTPKVDDWFKSFQLSIVPCAVKHSLPLTN